MTKHPLKSYRDEVGISAALLGERLGLTRQSIHRIENGRQVPSSEVLRRVETATGGKVTPNDIIKAMPPIEDGAAA